MVDKWITGATPWRIHGSFRPVRISAFFDFIKPIARFHAETAFTGREASRKLISTVLSNSFILGY